MIFLPPMKKHDYHWYRSDAPAELRQTAWLAEKAVSFIRERSACEQPWLLSVNCYDLTRLMTRRRTWWRNILPAICPTPFTAMPTSL